MLVEKSREDALKDYIEGKKVLVLIDYEDGSFDTESLDKMLPEESHYLVNEPAIQNPEIVEIIKRIAPLKPEEIVKAVHETQGELGITPPQ